VRVFVSFRQYTPGTGTVYVDPAALTAITRADGAGATIETLGSILANRHELGWYYAVLDPTEYTTGTVYELYASATLDDGTAVAALVKFRAELPSGAAAGEGWLRAAVTNVQQALSVCPTFQAFVGHAGDAAAALAHVHRHVLAKGGAALQALRPFALVQLTQEPVLAAAGVTASAESHVLGLTFEETVPVALRGDASMAAALDAFLAKPEAIVKELFSVTTLDLHSVRIRVMGRALPEVESQEGHLCAAEFYLYLGPRRGA